MIREFRSLGYKVEPASSKPAQQSAGIFDPGLTGILQHDSAWFPLRNPAIVIMPASFLVGSGVLLFQDERSAQTGILKPKGRVRLR
jgi:hypothetical protein